MWLCECPNLDQGIVRPLVTSDGYVVLMCDSGGEVWLRPEDVPSGAAYYPEAPEWKVSSCISVEPATTRWANREDLLKLTWDVDWRS